MQPELLTRPIRDALEGLRIHRCLSREGQKSFAIDVHDAWKTFLVEDNETFWRVHDQIDPASDQLGFNATVCVAVGMWMKLETYKL